ncbi:MAG: hypothetical protein MUF04_00520 [Akkermansiaceae bacterium]|nr:hypothetical protein [Akkermansiaceae bacterium]
MKTLLLLLRSPIVAAGLTGLAAALLLGWQHQRHQREIAALTAPASPGSSRSGVHGGADRDAVTARASAKRASTHPTAVLDALAIAEPAARIRALLAYAEDVPVTDIATAIRQLRACSPDWDPDARTAIHLLLTRWAREAPEQALASLRGGDPAKQAGDATSILAGIASGDPKRATEWLADPGNVMAVLPLIGHFLAGSIGKEWARQNPDAAVAWAAQLPDSQRTGAYVGILGTLAGSNPAAASAYVTRLEDGGARMEAIKHIATVWGKQSPQAAADWAMSLSDKERTAALKETLGSWAGHQPAAAARFLESVDAAIVTADHLKAVAEPWTSQAPATAAAWVAARAEGEARDSAMSSVMWRWTTAEPTAASTWLRAQPAGPVRDAGTTGLALAVFDTDPVSALDWAASISDPGKRDGAVKIGVTEWLKRDAAAARQWAAAHQIPMPPQ